VWPVAGYELDKLVLKVGPERWRELLVHVKSPFIEHVGFQTVQTFGPMSTAFKTPTKYFFFIAETRAVATDYIRLHSGRLCRLSLCGARSGVGEYSSASSITR